MFALFWYLTKMSLLAFDVEQTEKKYQSLISLMEA